jgi:hypothetical protein
MLTQILIGSALISVIILLQAVFIEAAIMALRRIGKRLVRSRPFLTMIALTAGLTFWMLAALSLAIWIWALAFMALGTFETLESSLYFSVVSFTTLGFGDVILRPEWRLLSGFCAANGLILFGLNTAFFVNVLGRIRELQEPPDIFDLLTLGEPKL